MQQAQMNRVDAAVLRALTAALSRGSHAEASPPDGSDGASDMSDIALLDSQRLLDIILEVEERCGRVFDADRVDFADDLTVEKLAGAFV
jgi:hypothetical protein